VVTLCNRMMERFGGVAGFAQLWWEQFDAARRNQPGSKRVLDGLMAILNLVEMCQSLRPQSDLSSSTDQELDRELCDLLNKLAQQPDCPS
jgi:hypothetical protein